MGEIQQGASLVNLLYFARLREELGRSTETLELPRDVITVAGLRALLATRGGPWSEALCSDKAVRVAVNQEMARDATTLKPGDEIAFFPPVTGG